MVLYIEYVIMDNLIVDYLLIKLLSFTFKEKFKKINVFFSCLIGTISAIFLPFLCDFKLLLWCYKVLTALVMILILKKYKTYRKYFLYLLVFFTYTFVLGGIAFGILNIFAIDYTINGLLLYNCEFPLSLFICIFWIGGWLFKKVILALNTQLKYNNYLMPIKLIDNGNEIEGIGYFDSGNTLDKDGKGVSIISIDLFMKLHKNFPFEKLLFRNVNSTTLKDPCYIDIRSIATSGKYLSFTIDQLVINDQVYENATVAVALKNFKNFDCIINSKMGGVCNE